MGARSEMPLIEPRDRDEWRAWLEANHATTPSGVWLAVGKKGNPHTPLAYDEAVEEALCFGWIDGTTNTLDEDRFRQRFTRRRAGGTWARSNKLRVERLIAEGRMTPAGLAAIEAAKADGTWTMLDDVEDLIVPDDLAQALVANPDAARHFEGFSPSSRKMLLWWVVSAKRPATRATRIEQLVAEAARGRRAGIDR